MGQNYELYKACGLWSKVASGGRHYTYLQIPYIQGLNIYLIPPVIILCSTLGLTKQMHISCLDVAVGPSSKQGKVSIWLGT
jgi:hypothetical protein